MKLPTEAIADLSKFNNVLVAYGDECKILPDPKSVHDLIEYAEQANARIGEIERQNASLIFKLRCVGQALK